MECVQCINTCRSIAKGRELAVVTGATVPACSNMPSNFKPTPYLFMNTVWCGYSYFYIGSHVPKVGVVVHSIHGRLV